MHQWVERIDFPVPWSSADKLRFDELSAELVGTEEERDGVLEQGLAQCEVEEHVLSDAGRLQERTRTIACLDYHAISLPGPMRVCRRFPWLHSRY
jgi:hypothetical protein